MKFTTPQIVWHSKDPVYSADFHHSGELWRLVTGGADKDVKIWKVVREEGKMAPVFMASLSRHSGTVNVVRFSPSGELLASAGDDNVVCLWKLEEGGGGGGNVAMDTTPNKENWTVTKILRGHLEDIYDVCWSANSCLLVTGSVDNTAIVWDINKGQSLCTLNDSKQYVQGVTWDPIGQYLATLSSDRYLRIYSAADQKFRCVHTVSKMTVPEQGQGVGGKQFRMWLDETHLSFFFRRLSFSPDGNLLVVPAGRFESGDKVTNMTYIFTKTSLTKPAVCLPCPDKATVVVKFCPLLFKLRDAIDKEKHLFSLPYRMVYAVASLDAVLLYDTQQTTPFAYLSNLHYSGITDLAWSDDGLLLVVTSSDAYCSIVTFEPGELGVALATEDYPETMKQSKKKPEKKVGGKNIKEKANQGKQAQPLSTSPTKNKSRETTSTFTSTNETSVESRSSDLSGRQVRCSSHDNRGSPTSVGSKVNATTSGGVGVTNDVKGKRRISTTIMETFTTSSLSAFDVKTTPSPLTPSPSPTPSSSNPVSTPPAPPMGDDIDDDIIMIVARDDRPSLVVDVNSQNETNATCVREVSASGKKSRRIQLVTLSSVSPQMSHDSDSKSCDQDSAHLSSSSKTISDDIAEPMEVSTNE